MPENEAAAAKLGITREEARRIAGLLRYAVSLNTTVGLVSPTQRRLATSTYRAVELAACVLEGRPLEEALQEADQAWSGSLAADHDHALGLLERERAPLREAMSGHFTAEQLAEYFEITEDQFVELIRQMPAGKGPRAEPGG